MKSFKRIAAAALIVVMCLSAVACSKKREDAKEKYGSDVLKIYLPGEYMASNLVGDFEKEFGVKVIPEFFDSNEMMYTKFSAGETYDVLIPSDYMIERLIKEEQLQKIDQSLIPNMKNLAPEVLNAAYDSDNTYSVPYFWGTVGIVYNKNNVQLSELESKGWDIFRDSKYAGKTYFYDSERDGFMIAAKQLGYSANSSDEAEINAEYEWLLDMNKSTSPIYVTDDVIDGMIGGTKDLAVVYSGDAVTILSENEDMSYFVPEQGTNRWYDAMVIPANAENPLLAHEFINFVISDDISRDNTEAVGYASPNANILKEMTAEDGEYAGNNAYYPRNYELDEIYHDDEKLRKTLSELWIKVKAAQ